MLTTTDVALLALLVLALALPDNKPNLVPATAAHLTAECKP
ncbi:hypothetical protein [Pseudomonas sp. L-22-4S-12]|nr:hypothetical protein [Pseudomonas sp. L-22-4S-12]